MAEIARWHNHRFEVSPSIIKSFNDLQLRVVLETTTVTEDWQKYEKRNNGKPAELSFTLHLCAGLGYDVRSEAEAYTTSVFSEDSGYFYVGTRKLYPCQFVLTEATISSVEINATGVWTKADVSLKFKQASVLDGTQPGTSPASTGSSNGGTASSPAKVTVSPTKMTAGKTDASALSDTTKSAVSSAVSSIESITATAKTTSAAAKKAGSMKKNYVALPM